MDHALSFEKGWEDYGRSTLCASESALWLCFIDLFANLQKWCREHNPPTEQYSHEDMRRFWEAYKRGAYAL